MIGTPGANTGGLGGGTPVPTPIAQGSAAPAQHIDAAPSGAVSIPPLSLEGMVLSDRYRVLKKLGEGGMGSVYLAEHTTIKKRLAIKVLSSEYSHKQDLVDRFLQEARAASMIDQQNVVEITDFGSVPNGSVFFVMEFLNGEDLSRTIKTQGALPWHRVKPIMLQICAALTAAHEVGIIHRDMKPENCYRIKRGSNEDFIKVLDFGIAKVTTDDGEGGGRGLTRTGMIFGTPEYMSPEQAKGERVDFRVDVYAVGVILYELLTGQVPFTADTFMGILTKHMFEAPPAPSQVAPEADIPEQVEAIILKALQKDREYRFQSMRDLADAIEAVGTDSAAVSVVAERVVAPSGGQTHFSTSSPAVPLAGPGTMPPEQSKSRGGLIGIAAFVLVLGGAAAFYFSQDDGKTKETEAKPAAVAAPAEPTPPPKPASDDAGKPPVEPAADDGETPPPEPEPTVAAITISTPGIVGEIVDSRDDTVLGATNEAFELPLGTDSLDLIVRAEGYEELVVPAVPDGDKTVVAALTKAPKGRKGGRRGGRRGGRNGKGGTKAGDTKTTDTKASDTKPKNNGGSSNSGSSGGGSPDLKDPFRNR